MPAILDEDITIGPPGGTDPDRWDDDAARRYHFETLYTAAYCAPSRAMEIPRVIAAMAFIKRLGPLGEHRSWPGDDFAAACAIDDWDQRRRAMKKAYDALCRWAD